MSFARLASAGAILLLAAFVVFSDEAPRSLAAALPSTEAPPQPAAALVKGFSDPNIFGIVTFTPVQGDSGTFIYGVIHGLKVGMTYAVHVHEKGNCAAPDSAGGHFHVGDEHHGNPFALTGEHHSGDLPNIKIDSTGTGSFYLRTPVLDLNAGPRYVVGRSLIVHAARDDYHSQPSGNSGARIACGVIRAVQ